MAGAAGVEEEPAVATGIAPIADNYRPVSFNSRDIPVDACRLQWLRIAGKYLDQPFVTYDVIEGPEWHTDGHTAEQLQVRGRSIAEAVMAYIDYLNGVPTPGGDDAYGCGIFELEDDDAVAETSIDLFAGAPDNAADFFWLRAIGNARVLVVDDLPDTGPVNKRARSE